MILELKDWLRGVLREEDWYRFCSGKINQETFSEFIDAIVEHNEIGNANYQSYLLVKDDAQFMCLSVNNWIDPVIPGGKK